MGSDCEPIRQHQSIDQPKLWKPVRQTCVLTNRSLMIKLYFRLYYQKLKDMLNHFVVCVTHCFSFDGIAASLG